ncbi:MAG: signal peptidase I [Sciscionella sp.]
MDTTRSPHPVLLDRAADDMTGNPVEQRTHRLSGAGSTPQDPATPHCEDDQHATPAADPPPRSATRRVLGVLASLLGGLIVAVIAAVALALTLVPAIGGGHTLTVLSGSMVPALPVGSVVVDRPAPSASLRTGDVVTYATTDEVSGRPILITHRIVAIHRSAQGTTFTTKGDANNVADNRPVAASQIRGKLWYHIPYIGTARNVLANRTGLLLLGGAIVLIGASVFLRRLFRSDSTADTPDAEPSATSKARHSR